jgi:hypothetical protein
MDGETESDYQTIKGLKDFVDGDKMKHILELTQEYKIIEMLLDHSD